MQHYFSSELLVSSGKAPVPRLRISVRTRDYNFITGHLAPNEELVFLKKAIIKRNDGQIVVLDHPRLSKGVTIGKYTQRYILIPKDVTAKYGFRPKEPIAVTVEW